MSAKFRLIKNESGSALVLSIILSLVLSIGVAVISSKIPWSFSFALKIDAAERVSSLMEQTSQFVISGLKERWCFTEKLKKKSTCSFSDAYNSERVLLDKNLSNPNSSLSNILEVIKEKSTTEAGRRELVAEGLPTDPKLINNVPLDGFKLNLSVSDIEDSPLKGAFSVISGVSYSELLIEVARSPDYQPLDREIAIDVTVKLTWSQGGTSRTYELSTTNLFFPRELNSFALISGRNLWLGTQSVADETVEGEDECKPDSTKDSIINFSDGDNKGLVFQSPVYVHGDTFLPSNSSELPVSFSSLTLGRRGALKVGDEYYTPDFSKGFKYTDSIGSLFAKISVEDEDKGLSVLSGQTACLDASLANCDLEDEVPIPAAMVNSVGGLEVGQWQMGDKHSCVILKKPGDTVQESGELRCWGNNNYGQIGNGESGSGEVVKVPERVGRTDSDPDGGLTKNVTHVAVGGIYTCAIVSGAAKCWGANNFGQLGDGSRNSRLTPVDVTGLSSGVTMISVASNTGMQGASTYVSQAHTCAIVNGGVKCWGRGLEGQLGDGSRNSRLTPVDVTGLSSGATAIAAGRSHTCAIVNGAVKCWGEGTYGELGNGSRNNSTIPVNVVGIDGSTPEKTATSIAAGHSHTCAIVNGGVKCWGVRIYSSGTVTIGSGSTRQVAGLGSGSGVTAISAGENYTCAIVSGGVKCWGYGGHGRLGNGLGSSSSSPVSVTGIDGSTPKKTATSIAVGNNHSCAIVNKELKCWGKNDKSQADAGQNQVDENGHYTISFCPILGGQDNSFGRALWSTDFSPYSRLSWEFTDTDTPSKEFTNTDSLYTSMDVFDSDSQIRGIIDECKVKSSANFVVGMYFCDKFIIEARTTPLRIVGTVITNRLEVDPSAVAAGITWSALSHPEAFSLLKKSGVVLADETTNPIKKCPQTTTFSNPLSVQLREEAFRCSSSKLLEKADPFRWTTVDPDCGVTSANDLATRCKRHYKKFTVKQIRRKQSY